MHNRYVHFLLNNDASMQADGLNNTKKCVRWKNFIQSWKSIYIMFLVYIQPWNRVYMCEWTSRFYYCTLSTDFRLGMILYGSPYNKSMHSQCCLLVDFNSVVDFGRETVTHFNVSKFTPNNSPVKCEIATILIPEVL